MRKQSEWDRLWHYVADYGIVDTAARLAAAAGRRLLPRSHQRASLPLYADMHAAGCVYASPEELLRGEPALLRTDPEVSFLRAEYEELHRELKRRYQGAPLGWPESWGVQEGPAFLLYSLVRRLRPESVLEAGVANGHSTYFILHAMMANGRGELHSIDIDPAAGGLLRPAERDRWHFHLIEGRSHKKWFRRLLQELQRIDLLFQDGDQDPRWIAFMLQACREKMPPAALIAVNDADWSHAFLDHCRNQGIRPVFLMSDGKVVGLAACRGDAGLDQRPLA